MNRLWHSGNINVNRSSSSFVARQSAAGRPVSRVKWATLAGCCALMLAPLATPLFAAPADAKSETARNRVLIAAFADLFYRQKKVRAAFERYVSEDYTQHNPDFPDGRDGPIDGVQKLFGPDAKLEVKRIVVDGNIAVLHILARLKPGERGLAVVDIYRFSAGKIVEHWDVVQPIPAESKNPHPMF